MSYTHRYLARIVLEADTPLCISTGKNNANSQSPVIKDINGLPYIPSSSMAGVLRHAIGEENAKAVFGYQGSTTTYGSKVIFTDGIMIGKDGVVLDGIQDIDFADDFYQQFQKLPIRHHVRINHKGAGADKGKYDHEVVYKGTRFVSEIIMLSDGTNVEFFDAMIERLYDSTFALGGKTLRGIGKMKVCQCEKAILDLTKKKDLEDFLSKSASLSVPFARYQKIEKGTHHPEGWTNYTLELTPDDYFLFRAGTSDDNRYAQPVVESYIKWSDDGKPSFVKGCVLIPGSSVKGAISHRTAYHWNRLEKRYHGAANSPLVTETVYDKNGQEKEGDIINPAVINIFGVIQKKKDGLVRRGNCYIPDLIEEESLKEEDKKVFNHVAIDRLTGGALQTALFSENAVYRRGHHYTLRILVKTSALAGPHIQDAFEAALKDLKNGLLPLGGLTNRGYGVFTGTLKRNGEELL